MIRKFTTLAEMQAAADAAAATEAQLSDAAAAEAAEARRAREIAIERRRSEWIEARPGWVVWQPGAGVLGLDKRPIKLERHPFNRDGWAWQAPLRLGVAVLRTEEEAQFLADQYGGVVVLHAALTCDERGWTTRSGETWFETN